MGLQPREHAVPCQRCRQRTFNPTAVCDNCLLLAVDYRCCGGHGEHFEWCVVGDLIAAARRSADHRSHVELQEEQADLGAYDGQVA